MSERPELAISLSSAAAESPSSTLGGAATHESTPPPPALLLDDTSSAGNSISGAASMSLTLPSMTPSITLNISNVSLTAPISLVRGHKRHALSSGLSLTEDQQDPDVTSALDAVYNTQQQRVTKVSRVSRAHSSVVGGLSPNLGPRTLGGRGVSNTSAARKHPHGRLSKAALTAAAAQAAIAATSSIADASTPPSALSSALPFVLHMLSTSDLIRAGRTTRAWCNISHARIVWNSASGVEVTPEEVERVAKSRLLRNTKKLVIGPRNRSGGGEDGRRNDENDMNDDQLYSSPISLPPSSDSPAITRDIHLSRHLLLFPQLLSLTISHLCLNNIYSLTEEIGFLGKTLTTLVILRDECLVHTKKLREEAQERWKREDEEKATSMATAALQQQQLQRQDSSSMTDSPRITPTSAPTSSTPTTTTSTAVATPSQPPRRLPSQYNIISFLSLLPNLTSLTWQPLDSSDFLHPNVALKNLTSLRIAHPELRDVERVWKEEEEEMISVNENGSTSQQQNNKSQSHPHHLAEKTSEQITWLRSLPLLQHLEWPGWSVLNIRTYCMPIVYQQQYQGINTLGTGHLLGSKSASCSPVPSPGVSPRANQQNGFNFPIVGNNTNAAAPPSPASSSASPGSTTLSVTTPVSRRISGPHLHTLILRHDILGDTSMYGISRLTRLTSLTITICDTTFSDLGMQLLCSLELLQYLDLKGVEGRGKKRECPGDRLVDTGNRQNAATTVFAVGERSKTIVLPQQNHLALPPSSSNTTNHHQPTSAPLSTVAAAATALALNAHLMIRPTQAPAPAVAPSPSPSPTDDDSAPQTRPFGLVRQQASVISAQSTADRESAMRSESLRIAAQQRAREEAQAESDTLPSHVSAGRNGNGIVPQQSHRHPHPHRQEIIIDDDPLSIGLGDTIAPASLPSVHPSHHHNHHTHHHNASSNIHPSLASSSSALSLKRTRSFRDLEVVRLASLCGLRTLHLESLDLGHDGLHVMFHSLTQLHVLKLRKMRVNTIQPIICLTRLKSLTLEECIDIPEAQLISVLQQMRKLVEVRIIENVGVTEQVVKEMEDELEQWSGESGTTATSSHKPRNWPDLVEVEFIECEDEGLEAMDQNPNNNNNNSSSSHLPSSTPPLTPCQSCETRLRKLQHQHSHDSVGSTTSSVSVNSVIPVVMNSNNTMNGNGGSIANANNTAATSADGDTVMCDCPPPTSSRPTSGVQVAVHPPQPRLVGIELNPGPLLSSSAAAHNLSSDMLLSVFNFLTLPDVALTHRACKAWHLIATSSKHPSQRQHQLRLLSPGLPSLLSSSLRRHLISLNIRSGKQTLVIGEEGRTIRRDITIAQLTTLTQQLPHLQALQLSLEPRFSRKDLPTTPPLSSISFPPHLRLLNISFSTTDIPSHTIDSDTYKIFNTIHTAIGRLENLEQLTTSYLECDEELYSKDNGGPATLVTPLLPLHTHLTSLRIEGKFNQTMPLILGHRPWSEKEIDMFREFTLLRKLHVCRWWLTPQWSQMLRAPIPWQHLIEFDYHMTDFYLDLDEPDSVCMFELTKLPLLRHFTPRTVWSDEDMKLMLTWKDTAERVRISCEPSAPVDLKLLMECTVQMSRITSLSISHDQLTSIELEKIFSSLPLITQLHLRRLPQLTSLTCLTSSVVSHLPHQLQQLLIADCQALPWSESIHFRQLLGLTTLKIRRAMRPYDQSNPASSPDLLLLRTPTAERKDVWPKLTLFEYDQLGGAWQNEFDDFVKENEQLLPAPIVQVDTPQPRLVGIELNPGPPMTASPSPSSFSSAGLANLPL